MISKYELWVIFNLIFGIIMIITGYISMEIFNYLFFLPAESYEVMILLTWCVLFGGSFAQYLIVKSRRYYNFYCEDEDKKMSIPEFIIYDRKHGVENIGLFLMSIILSILWAFIAFIPAIFVIIAWRVIIEDFHTIVELAEKAKFVK